ncbi:MAG: hypothetical protein RSD82_14400, partial [Comamonas sp.]
MLTSPPAFQAMGCEGGLCPDGSGCEKTKLHTQNCTIRICANDPILIADSYLQVRLRGRFYSRGWILMPIKPAKMRATRCGIRYTGV